MAFQFSFARRTNGDCESAWEGGKIGTEKRRSIPTWFAIAALAIVIAACLVWLPEDFSTRVLAWVERLGAWGPVVVGALYIPAAVLMIPGSLITLGAGALFGLVPGVIAISIGSTLGAAAAFLVGRWLLRGFVEERIANYPKFAAIDRAVARQGFRIVLLIRLSPIIPFNVSNYAFGLTRISLGSYVLASWIGMFPATVMYVYLGHTAGSLAGLRGEQHELTGARLALLIVGLVATIAVTVVIARLARRALDDAVGAEQEKIKHEGAEGVTPAE